MNTHKLRIWVLAAVCLLLFGVCLVNATYLNLDYEWTSLRLAPTYAFWQGYPIYSTTSEPPWVMVGYGPLYPLMYTPSIVAAATSPAVAIATLLSHIFILAPLFLLARLASNNEKSPALQGVVITVLLYLFFVSVPSLKYVVIRVAADAPAFGFQLLSAWFLLRSSIDKRSNMQRGACIAGALMGMSIACKINLAPALATFAIWCFWFCGWRATLGLLTCAAAAVASAYVVACINSDPQAILLSLKILNGYPWGIFPSAKKFTAPADKFAILVMQMYFIFSSLGLVLLLLILFLQPVARDIAARRLPNNAAPVLATFFLLLALNMLLPAAATSGKWGGGVNSWALFTLPLTLAAAFAVMYYARDVGTISNRFLLVLSLPWVLVILISTVKPWELKRNIDSMPGTYALESYRLVAECKGTCYLPFDPLAHLLIEKVFRPNMDVIYSFALGGTAVDQTAFNAALPPHLATIYFPKSITGWGIHELKRLTGFQETGELRTSNKQQLETGSKTTFIVLTPNRELSP